MTTPGEREWKERLELGGEFIDFEGELRNDAHEKLIGVIETEIANAKREAFEDALNCTISKHTKARTSYGSDSWDAGYHDALFDVQRTLLLKIDPPSEK